MRYLGQTSLLALALLAGLASVAHADVIINEVLFDVGGTDGPNEYIELRDTSGTQVTIPANTYLIALESDATSSTGEVQFVFDISGLMTDANGFLALLPDGNPFNVTAGDGVYTCTGGTGWEDTSSTPDRTDSFAEIENAAATFMVINTATAPTIGQDYDTNDDGALDGMPGDALVTDSVAVLDSATDTGYGFINFVDDMAATVPMNSTVVLIGDDRGYIGRDGNSTGWDASDWVCADDPQVSGSMVTLPTTMNDLPAGDVVPPTYLGAMLDNIGEPNFGASQPDPIELTLASSLTDTVSIPVDSTDAIVGDITLAASGATFVVDGFEMQFERQDMAATDAPITAELINDANDNGAVDTNEVVGMFTVSGTTASITGLSFSIADAVTARWLIRVSLTGSAEAPSTWMATFNNFSVTGGTLEPTTVNGRTVELTVVTTGGGNNTGSGSDCAYRVDGSTPMLPLILLAVLGLFVARIRARG